MSESPENTIPGSFPTSEVGCGTRECNDGGSASKSSVTTEHYAVGSAGCSKNSDNATCSESVSDTGDAAALLKMLRVLAGGLQPPAPVALIKFDPDDPDADIEGWCKINEMINARGRALVRKAVSAKMI
ncbi:uncharacterized protein LOC135081800 [Ostrinia nubilalis]|uniref:uncharacterized protein LOC135081800 n=1 Tax=Ostrinia nubilalis TaxID=29057 RepID=UPI0030826B7E